MLEPGQQAPAFELPNQHGETVTLDDFAGSPLVVYFYPRAGTGGCTMEANGFRDAWDEYTDRGVNVVGISADDVEALSAFSEDEGLPFDLLSDEDGTVASAYESFGTKEMGGDTYEIAFRNTYLVDADGRIERVYEDVSPEGHAREILDDLDEG